MCRFRLKEQGGKIALVLGIPYFYGILFWLPQIVKSMAGTNDMVTSILSAIPWITAIIVMGIVAGYADRSPKKKKFIAVPIFIGALGLLAGTYFHNLPVLALACLSLSTACCECPVGPFWTLPSRIFDGLTGAAAIAIINAIGNLGGFFGPYLFGLVSTGNNYNMGFIVLASMMILSSALAMLVKEK